jgi:hypothetical protein
MRVSNRQLRLIVATVVDAEGGSTTVKHLLSKLYSMGFRISLSEIQQFIREWDEFQVIPGNRIKLLKNRG